MESPLDKFYDPNFYSLHSDGATSSAKAVLALLYKYLQPKSVIDIGCGRGAWLAVAESLGSNKLRGFDGSWIKKEDLFSPTIDFSPVNFDIAMPEVNEKYDLCICVEVAEHIAEKRAMLFIDTLCKASDVVLFSAATKFQGGTNHINEQWQSYWVDLFKANGFECFDTLRPALWANESVKWWYRQNILLFRRQNSNTIDNSLLKAAARPILDIIHPENHKEKIQHLDQRLHQLIECPSLEFSLGCLKKSFMRKVRRLILNAK